MIDFFLILRNIPLKVYNLELCGCGHFTALITTTTNKQTDRQTG